MLKSFLSLSVLFCLLANTAQARPTLRVSVSIPPQQYLLQRIGGEFVDIQVLLKPGESPETFDPSLRQISELANTHLYFRIGVAFEKKWLNSIAGNNRKIKIVDCCDNIIARQSVSLDNHSWTSARNIQLMAALIRQELINIDPARAAVYEQNYAQLVIELEQLDNEIYGLLSQRRTDYFIIAHAALGHFAEDYGLIQMSLEDRGKELGAKSLVNMVRQAREQNIRTLFVQKQHPSATALAFAREIDASIVEIDPLHGDYIANLRQIANLIAQATQ